MASSRQIVANLDIESHWQRLLLPHRPMPQLGQRALSLISAYGTLLRAWSSPDEPGTLWTPAPVDPARLTRLLPVPTLASGSARAPEPTDLCWGRIDEAAARVNHRRFALELSARLDVGLPGAAWVRDFEELLEAIACLDRWVAKAPLSASGRDRVVGTGPPDEPTPRRLRNLVTRSDGLLVEPWMERIDDFGTLIEVDDEGCHVVSMHRQIVSETGAFVGIDWPLNHSSWAEDLRTVAHSVGKALRREGYRGPASVDAWSWRRGDGSEGSVALNPLGEINGRLSFGWVARQIGLRLGRERVRLRLGSGRAMASAIRVEPLLLPDSDGAGAAWLVA